MSHNGYERWVRSWSQSLRQSAHRPAVGCHYFPLGPRLPSQPNSVTALWPVPYCLPVFGDRGACVSTNEAITATSYVSRMMMSLKYIRIDFSMLDGCSFFGKIVTRSGWPSSGLGTGTLWIRLRNRRLQVTIHWIQQFYQLIRRRSAFIVSYEVLTHIAVFSLNLVIKTRAVGLGYAVLCCDLHHRFDLRHYRHYKNKNDDDDWR